MFHADVLVLVGLPEWPAASTILMSWIHVLIGEKGLASSDASIRQTCLDLLGLIAATLCDQHLSCNQDTGWLVALLQQAGMRSHIHGVSFISIPWVFSLFVVNESLQSAWLTSACFMPQAQFHMSCFWFCVVDICLIGCQYMTLRIQGAELFASQMDGTALPALAAGLFSSGK